MTFAHVYNKIQNEDNTNNKNCIIKISLARQFTRFCGMAIFEHKYFARQCRCGGILNHCHARNALLSLPVKEI